ncbi:hypothetical protein NFI96_025159 [Prochilodus magdalenae]|nr:hypothetical protein NFI96_025159 [Prochilodus magdalenae]
MGTRALVTFILVFMVSVTNLRVTAALSEMKADLESSSEAAASAPTVPASEKTSARDNKQLRKIAVSNRFKSTSELTDLWNKQTGADVSRSTTYRRLRELGFKSRVPAVKPMLNKKQMEKRLKWAKEHGEWTAEDCQKVVFSDESRFCISFGDQGPRVWRRGGKTYNHECVKRSVKFPQSVMVWGCMSARGVGKLCFLKKTVNAAVYQNVLETFLIPTVEEQFGEEDFIFQQDLAPAHAAKSTKDWFTKKQLEVLAWPANSPDLNVIENLWAIVKRKIRDRKPTTLDQLKQNIATAWEATLIEVMKLLSSVAPLSSKMSTDQRVMAAVNEMKVKLECSCKAAESQNRILTELVKLSSAVESLSSMLQSTGQAVIAPSKMNVSKEAAESQNRTLTKEAKLPSSLESPPSRLQSTDQRPSDALSEGGAKLENSTAEVSSCKPGWILNGSSCYFFSNNKLNWHQAQEYCRSQNASLLKLETKEEWVFVTARTKLYHHWVGLRQEITGQWKWDDGTPYVIDQADWEPGQPDDSKGHGLGEEGEDCGDLKRAGKLNDAHCSNTLHYICKVQIM